MVNPWNDQLTTGTVVLSSGVVASLDVQPALEMAKIIGEEQAMLFIKTG